MLVVVGMIASIRQVSKYIITKDKICCYYAGGGGLIEVKPTSGSVLYWKIYYQVPVGAKVKVEFQFQKTNFVDSRDAIEIYNSEQKGEWSYRWESSDRQHLIKEYSYYSGGKETSPIELEFISKGWVYIFGWNMPASSRDWLSDSAPYAGLDYLKVSYEKT